MADYDLGTARGKIVISEDSRGADEAARSLAELAVAAKALERAFRSTESAMTQMEKNLQQSASHTQRANQATNNFQNSLQRIGSTIGSVTGEIFGMNSATQALERTMGRAIRTGIELRDTLEGMTSVSGVIERVSSSFIGLNETMSSMPQWIRTLGRVSGEVSTFGAVASGVLPRVGRAFRAVGVAATTLSPIIASAAAAFAPLGFIVGGITEKIGHFSSGVFQAARGVGQMVTGAALLTNAFRGIGTAAKFATIGLGGISAVAAGTKAVGVVALGTANAIKQLSGALLILPGLYAGIGITAGVAKLAFTGITEAFKAAAGDASKFEESIKDMTPTMQGIARSVKDVIPQFKNLQNIASETVLAGFKNDIQDFTKNYMPTLERGVRSVGTSLNAVKNGFRDFVLSPATVGDTNKMFNETSTILHNVARAVWPVSAALRDVAVVGLEVFSDLTGGAGLAGKRFGDFIAQARKSGDLKRWMEDGIQGFRDLGSTIKDTGSAFATIFQAFGANGDNALERLAAGAEKFRAAIERSSQGGGLDTVAASLERMSSVSMEVISTALAHLLNVMREIAPFAEAMSTAFGSTLITSLNAVGKAAELIATGLSKVSGLGSIVGTLVAMGVAFKALTFVMLPVTRGVTAVVGALSLLRGAGNAINGVTASMQAAGVGARVAGVQMGALGTAIAGIGTKVPVIAKMQDSFVKGAAGAQRFGRTIGTVRAAMTGLSSAASGLVSLIGGPWVAAFLAAVGVIYSFVAQGKDLSTLQGLLNDKAQATTKSVQGFTKAFTEANGVMGKGVTQDAIRQFDELQTKVTETATKTSGVMSDIGAFFKDAFSWSGIKDTLGGDPVPWINNKKNSELDHMAQAAGRAKDSFGELKVTSEQVGNAITGTDGDWQQLIANLRNTSNGGADAIAQLQPLRDAFIQTRDSMARVGPGAVALQNALEVIADASSTAAERLGAMEDALRAMGLLQVDAVEAMANVTEAVKAMDESLQGPIGTSENLGSALLNATGGLNAMNPAAQELWRRVKPLSESLRDVAASGGDVNGAFEQMRPSLEALRQQTGLSEAQWQQLIRTMGLTPDVLTTLVQMKGAPEAVQELLGLQTALAKVPPNTPVNVFIQDQNVLAQLRAIGAGVQVINSTTGEVRITAPTEEVQNKINALIRTVQTGANGQVSLSTNFPAVQNQAQAIVQQMIGIGSTSYPVTMTSNIPQIKNEATGLAAMFAGLSNKEIPAPPVEQPQIPVPAPPPAGTQPPLPAPLVTAPVTPPILPPVSQPPLPAPPVQQPQVPTPAPPAMPEIAPPIIPTPVIPTPAPPALPEMPQPAPIALQITGQENVIGAIQSINAALAESTTQWNNYSASIQGALAQASTHLQTFASNVTNILNSASTNAYNSGATLGQGFADGISSKVEAVRNAAMALANAAAAPLPRSPAKIGPFSGTGWTPFRGRSLALGFAKGIEDNSQEAQNATLDMVRGIAAAMDSIRTTFNVGPATSFDANRTPGAGGKRFYRDPNVSQEDLRKKRADREAAEAQKKAEDERFKAFDDQKKAAQEQDKASRKSSSVKVDGKTDPNAAIVPAIEKIANEFGLALTSGQRNEPGSFHNTGQAGDFSNGVRTDQELAFANFMADNFRPFIRELIFDDPRFDKQIKDGRFVERDFFAGAGDHTNHVHVAMDEAPVIEKGLDKLSEKQQKAQEKASEKADQNARSITGSNGKSRQDIVDAIVAEGQARGLSEDEIAAGVSTGLVESDLRDLPDLPGEADSAGVFQQRPSQGWGTAGQGVEQDAKDFFDRFEQTDPSRTPGQRAQDTQRSAFPEKYQQRMAEAMELTQQSMERQGTDSYRLGSSTNRTGEKQLSTEEEMLRALKSSDQHLYEQVQIAKDPNSSDADVIRALQDIDDNIALTDNRDVYEGLQQVRDAVMEERGIKEYDPFEGATEDLPGDMLKAAQLIVGMFNTLKSGLDNVVSTFGLLARGISNTKELNQVVDGFQSMASTVSEIVSSIGEIINIVATVAALAGAAIPGVGQVAAVVAGVTGGISAVNAVVDLIQEVVSIGGMFLGGLLSTIAGGAAGPLMGDVRVLLDLNDNTIKTWSDDNPDDKRVHQLPFGPGTPGGNQSIGINQLQIYQGPGQSTDQVLTDAMFYVRTSQAGAY